MFQDGIKQRFFLKNNKNVIIENGKDNTGNLYSSENYKYCVKKYSPFYRYYYWRWWI